MTLLPTSDLEPFLARLVSRSVLEPAEQDAIRGLRGHAVQVAANTDFVSLGQSIDHVCYVVEGLVGRFDQTAEGVRQITALHIPGDVADLHSIVQPVAGSALQALAATTVLKIDHAAIRRISARYPAIAEALWRDCAVDAAILSKWLVNVGRRDARSRVAHLLCETATRHRQPDQGHAPVFDFAVTQAQLADATGMSAVHVNRILQGLRETVSVSNKAVCIHDWQALAYVGEFDAGYLQIAIEPAHRLRISGMS